MPEFIVAFRLNEAYVTSTKFWLPFADSGHHTRWDDSPPVLPKFTMYPIAVMAICSHPPGSERENEDNRIMIYK